MNQTKAIPNIEVEDIDHLGIIAGIIDDIGYTFAVFALALRVKILKNLGKGEWFAEFPNALMIE